MKIVVTILFVCVVYICHIVYAYAEDIVVYKSILPQRFMLVDKKQQVCTLYGVNEEPISYICSSGQVDGDKEIEGDKKTPEGAYFITGSILEGLDFEEYGSRAYPLNYPNPIDTIEEKTGYGIWVHGKGQSFKPRGTRGCVAFPEKDILTLYPNFIVSYPVIIGETVTLDAGEPSSDYLQVRDAVFSWARAWSEQADSFFTHYDSSKRANFKLFQGRKQYFFSRFPFTFVDIETPYVVRKGRYYTTWFRQYYYAPNMLIEGTRYLYWELGKDNIPRIIAEEWKPGTTPETKERFKQKMIVQVKAFLEQWKQAWEECNLKEYIAMYSTNALQGNLRGTKAISMAKERTWKRKKPQHISIENIRVSFTPKGIEVHFKQIYQASGNYRDIGEKTLFIIPRSNVTSQWRIVKETWTKMNK